METESVVLSRAIGESGGIGARWMARLMPVNAAEQTVTVEIPAARVRDAILRLLGTALLPPPDSSPADPIRALVGSGRLNLNPALLTITIASPGESTTQVSVRGAAKEGLVKQRGGEQALTRFIGVLASSLAQARAT